MLQEKFIENEEEPNLFRCQAACAILQMKWTAGEKASAAILYRNLAYSIMTDTTSEHLAQVTMGFHDHFSKDGPSPYEATVAEFYKDMRE